MRENDHLVLASRTYSKLRMLLAVALLLAGFIATLFTPISTWTSELSFEESRGVFAVVILLLMGLTPRLNYLASALACVAAIGFWSWVENTPQVIQYRNTFAFTGAILIPVLAARCVGFRLTFEAVKSSTATMRILDLVLITLVAAALLAISRQASERSDANYTVAWPVTMLPFLACVVLVLLCEISVTQRILITLFWASLPLITLGTPVWDSETLLAFVASDIIKTLGWCVVITQLLRILGVRAYRSGPIVTNPKEISGHVRQSPTPIA